MPALISAPKAPVAPRIKGAPRPARMPDDDLVEDAMIRGVLYNGEAFAGRSIELAEAEQSRFDTVSFTGTRTRQTIFSDADFRACDFAQLRAEDTSLIRAAVTGSRMTGASWSKSFFQDLRMENSRCDLSHWRDSKFKAVAFVDCNLTQADFQWAEMRDVEFLRCTLTGAQFAHAQMTRVFFQDCTMHDVGGAENLKGATVRGSGGLELALALARGAGITIEL